MFEDRWRDVGGRPDRVRARPHRPPPRRGRPTRRSGWSGPTSASGRSRTTIYHAVDHARHSIYLENPYFSDEILTDKLVAARTRGVDVRAVLTLRGNVRRLNEYETLTANRLLRGDVRVYLFPAMTHVKAMSADGVWAYLGTGNFDELSLRNNREVALSVASPEVVRELDRTALPARHGGRARTLALMPTPKNLWLLKLLALWY